MIRVLIADDTFAARDGVSALLCPEYGFEVVGLAKDGLEAVTKAKELLPDVVVMDAQMPHMDGIQATQLIKKALPETGVLVFSVFTDYLESGMAAGADGCLSKDCDPDDLMSELKRIAALVSRGG